MITMLTLLSKQTNASAITNLDCFHICRTQRLLSNQATTLWEHIQQTLMVSFTLTAAVDNIEIGLDYTPELITLPPEFQLPDGISFGRNAGLFVLFWILNDFERQNQRHYSLIRRVTNDFSVRARCNYKRKKCICLVGGNEGTVTLLKTSHYLLTINGLLLEVEV